jgi:two-component system, chemotaxis family, sensor kinase CheA
VRFAHRFETALDDVRSKRMALTTEVMTVFLRAADQLAELVTAARDERPSSAEAAGQIISRLESLSVGTPAATAARAEPEDLLEFAPMALDFGPRLAATGAICYRIDFAAHEQLFANGSDPVHIFRELSRLGDMQVSANISEIEDLEDLSPDQCRLRWALRLTTPEPKAAILDVFDFVEGLCNLEIAEEQEAESFLPGPVDLELHASEEQEGEAPSPPQSPSSPAVDKSKASDPANRHQGAKATVRVDLDHVDRLINVVGELVINQAVLTQCIRAANVPLTTALSTSLDEFMALAREIQEGVMSIRAQSVKPLFQRMARIAREAGDLAGKILRFETEGEATEVDKTVIERLVDPLTHIIRNSVDHGLETQAVRRATGKVETGMLLLRAAHRSGRVIIEVTDDGAGINRPRVLEIAIKRGLVAPDAVLSNAEIDKLLFMPGFSTAPKITDLSGRGVGMDVVRSEVQKLGGRIAITSESGVGTTISISLPLTLAVLDGMVVDVSGHTMVVPITTIVETIRPKASDIHKLSGGDEVVCVRDRFIPIIDLGRVFGFRDHTASVSSLVFLLVESDQDKLWALAVDHIHDQRQVVIKGLESNYGHIRGVAAATILGDGKVALIIDPEEAALRRETDPPIAASFQEF